MGIQLCNLNSLWEKRVLQKVKSLVNQHHILVNEFVLMPSGRSYLQPPAKTIMEDHLFPQESGC